MVLIAAAWLAVAPAEPVCAKRTFTTLRKGAGEKHPVSWKVPRYMPFVRLDNKAGWSKLQDLEGEIHWARQSDVTNRVRCVVVKSNMASLHRDPAAGSPSPGLKTVDRYTPFLRVADQGEWVQIKDEAGILAWIQVSQVWKPVMVSTISF